MTIDPVTSSTDEASEKLGRIPYVLGGMSFIPLIGVIFGIITIIWGMGTKKHGGKRLAAIGAGGIGFTIILYGSLFYFGFIKRGGISDDLRKKLAQTTINSLVQSIEFYKVQHGSYPESLKALQDSLPKENFVSTFDPTDMKIGKQPKPFYYERKGDDHYYLRGIGSDDQPFTSDDIIPQVSLTPNNKVGLLVERKPTL